MSSSHEGGRGGGRGGPQRGGYQGGRGIQGGRGFQGGRGGGRGGGGGGGRGGHQGSSNSSNPSPALLTSLMKNANTIAALFGTCSKHESKLNHIHLSACWNSLGRLARDHSAAGPASWVQEFKQELESLALRTAVVVDTSTEIRARELANISHGVAKSGAVVGSSWESGRVEVEGGAGLAVGELMALLGEKITQRLGDCNPQELANIAWAFAKAADCESLSSISPPLFSALARVAQQHLQNFNTQELANTAWAFAKAGHGDAHHDGFLTAMAKTVQSRLDGFSAQGLANTAWAFATLGHCEADVFGAMSGAALQRLSEFNAQDLAHTAWAFAKSGQSDAELFSALAQSTGRHLSHFNAQGLANTVWAFAKVGHLDADLFASLASSIDRHLDSFNAQDLANISWAFAKACHPDDRLMSVLARRVEGCVDDFNAQDLVNTVWAFAKLGQFDKEMFVAVARSISVRRMEVDLNARHIANIAWAFAKADIKDSTLFTALARLAEHRVSEFNAQDLANVAWAFANAGQLDSQLFSSLAKSAEQFLEEFNDEELDNTEWAFASAGGQQRIVNRLRQRRKKRKEGLQADVDVSDCGKIVVAGGGIGGAAVAVALQSKGFEVVVLEADASFQDRSQGYGLTIQGIDAIQAMGINLAQDDAPSTSHYTFTAEGNILGFYGEEFSTKSKDRQEAHNSGRFVHIPRQMMRSRIVEQIRPGTIMWDSKLASFSCWNEEERKTENGNSDKEAKKKKKKKDSATPSQVGDGTSKKNGVTVTLTNGTTLEAALLVGADGIFSTVRRQLNLPGDRLNYVGLIVVLGIVPTPNGIVDIGSNEIEEGTATNGVKEDDKNTSGKTKKKKKTSDTPAKGGASKKTEGASIPVPLVQRRIFETVDGTTRIYAMPFTATSTMWQLSFPYEEKAARALGKDKVALKAEILRRCGEWHDPIPTLLRTTKLDDMAGYPVYDRELLEPHVLRRQASEAGAAAGQDPPPSSPSLSTAGPLPERRVTLMGDAAHPMTPFKAQGANQALSDAVLLADTLVQCVQQHGPHAGLDAALPLFERKMLHRSSRAVVGSREKAKELHSSLALLPARKVQRETDIGMQKVIQGLLAKGIGAQSAIDPRGLDAVVAEAIETSNLGEFSSLNEPIIKLKENKNPVVKKRKKENGEAEILAGGADKKRRKESASEAVDGLEANKRVWGYVANDWHKCVLVKTKKSGKHKVKWEDGTSSMLEADCIQPRVKKNKNARVKTS